MEIENTCTDYPRKLLDLFKKLKPKRKNRIPIEVYDNEGNLLPMKVRYSKFGPLRTFITP